VDVRTRVRILAPGGTQKKKHTKMSRRETKQTDPRAEMERMEEQRIEFEHRARMLRQNLYGANQADLQRGWVDHKAH